MEASQDGAAPHVDDDGFLILVDDEPNEEVMREVRCLSTIKRTQILSARYEIVGT